VGTSVDDGSVRWLCVGPGCGAPAIGLLLGRDATCASAGNHDFRNLGFRGQFTVSAVYSLASEVNSWYRVYCSLSSAAGAPVRFYTTGATLSEVPDYVLTSRHHALPLVARGGNTLTTFVHPVLNVGGQHRHSRVFTCSGVENFTVISPGLYTVNASAMIEIRDCCTLIGIKGGRSERAKAVPLSILRGHPRLAGVPPVRAGRSVLPS
jgi:hypothetical protein